jgi:hypothetical protein
MDAKTKRMWRSSRLFLPTVTLAILAAAALVLVECGGNSTGSGMGSANVTMSDPPSCTNNFTHVYITVTDVMAHTSASAPPNAAGWQNLTTQLSLTSPKQIDLLNPGGIQCLLAAELGSTQSLPAGSYQQFRLILANNGSNTTLNSNACTDAGLPSGTFNCVEAGSAFYPIELNSQQQTGLKIAPGQIVGGPITVAAGQSVDINIDLQACDSLVFDPGANAYRLRPVLTAYQVSPNLTGISGQVVVGTVTVGTPNTVTATSTPVPGALVAVEVPGPNDPTNSSSTDYPLGALTADSNGHFDFCPLPTAPGGAPMTFAMVADGLVGGVAYDATIIQTVPNGTQLTIPVLAQTGNSTAAGTLTGSVTATTSASNSAAFTLDADVVALQLATGSSLEFVVPSLSGSTSNPLSFTCPVTPSTLCTPVATTPVNNPYSLAVPVSAPLVGAFSSGSVSFSSVPAPLSGAATPTTSFVVEANSAPPSTSPPHQCNPAAVFSSSNTVTGTTPTSVAPLDLTGCQ